MATAVKVRFVRLTGLEGLKKQTTRAARAGSKTRAISLLRKFGAITASGDNGAINVWRDDLGSYRCEFMRYRSALDAMITDKISHVSTWIAEWWPKIDER